MTAEFHTFVDLLSRKELAQVVVVYLPNMYEETLALGVAT